jgi:acyl-CoA thioesterase-1
MRPPAPRGKIGDALRAMFAFFTCCLAACGAPQGSPVANIPAASEGSALMPGTDAPTVVMLGDSLTAGYELAEDEALPAAVERLLAARGVKATFVNAGVSGDTTADGLSRYDWSVAGANGDLLVVALGANDFLIGIPPERTKRNLAAILDRAKATGLPAVLIGVVVPDMEHDPRDAAFAAIYPALAKEYGVPLQPDLMAPVAGKPALLMDDGLHPTAKGVEAMAEDVADFLAPVIKALD